MQKIRFQKLKDFSGLQKLSKHLHCISDISPDPYDTLLTVSSDGIYHIDSTGLVKERPVETFERSASVNFYQYYVKTQMLQNLASPQNYVYPPCWNLK